MIVRELALVPGVETHTVFDGVGSKTSRLGSNGTEYGGTNVWDSARRLEDYLRERLKRALDDLARLAPDDLLSENVDVLVAALLPGFRSWWADGGPEFAV